MRKNLTGIKFPSFGGVAKIQRIFDGVVYTVSLLVWRWSFNHHVFSRWSNPPLRRRGIIDC